jgi:hypothetical protein
VLAKIESLLIPVCCERQNGYKMIADTEADELKKPRGGTIMKELLKLAEGQDCMVAV